MEKNDDVDRAQHEHEIEASRTTNTDSARVGGAPVIEIVTAKLKSDVAVAQMEAVDHEIGMSLIAKRRGFLSRESASGDDHSWLAIVRWRSAADADASMESFSLAPIAAKFMALIEPGTLVMKRFEGSRLGSN
jgi:hypothetical protein